MANSFNKLISVAIGFVVSVSLATAYRLVVMNNGIEVPRFWSEVALAIMIVPFVVGVGTLISAREASTPDETENGR